MRKLLMITVALFFFLSIADAQFTKQGKYGLRSSDPWRRYTYAAAQTNFWKIRRYEFAIGLGSTQFFGDLGGFSQSKNILGLKDISFLNTRYNISTGVKFKIRDEFAARLNLAFGSFHSTDIRGSNETRAMESTTMFFEPAIMFEYYFIKQKGDRSYIFIRGMKNFHLPIFARLDLYAFSGIGGLAYKVKPNDLLEAKGLKTNGFAAVVPVGLGVNILYSRDFNFGLELGGRYAFSDYVDGYTSPYSKSNDIYYFLNLNFTFRIKAGPTGLPSF